jgi:hypothetical protein
MVRRMTRFSLGSRAALLALGIGLAAMAVIGCSEGRSPEIRKPLSINAIAFNDSVAGGDTLLLKVQYTFGTTCEERARFEVNAVAGTSTYQIRPVAVYLASDACTGINGVNVATLRVTDVGNGARTFEVIGANTTLTAQVIGSTDPNFVKVQDIAFRVQVLDATTGAAAPLAHVQIRNVIDGSTLDEADADSNGRYSFIQPCGSGADLQYVVSVSFSGRTENLIVRTPPARCGIPEAVVIRV